jgi:hypothetical protein
MLKNGIKICLQGKKITPYKKHIRGGKMICNQSIVMIETMICKINWPQ